MQRYANMFAASRHAAYFSCMPTTFNLPKEYAAFEAAFEAAAQGAASSSTAPVQVRALAPAMFDMRCRQPYACM